MFTSMIVAIDHWFCIHSPAGTVLGKYSRRRVHRLRLASERSMAHEPLKSLDPKGTILLM